MTIYLRYFTLNYESQPHGGARGKNQRLMKVGRIHPLRNMNVSGKFHINPSDSCWDISVWTKAQSRAAKMTKNMTENKVSAVKRDHSFALMGSRWQKSFSCLSDGELVGPLTLSSVMLRAAAAGGLRLNQPAELYRLTAYITTLLHSALFSKHGLNPHTGRDESPQGGDFCRWRSLHVKHFLTLWSELLFKLSQLICSS